MRKILSFISLLVLYCTPLLAQNTITGKVTDSKDGSPLGGVTVRVKEGGTAVVTKEDGTFQIRSVSKQSVLVFSSIGFATEEVNVGSKTHINLSLSTEEKKLAEVVVVAYGSSDKKKVTGSIAKVSGKEFENVPMPSVDAMLQGKVAGLQSVASSGQPGAA